MQICDLGDEAIREILEEAADGMRRRTGKAWGLDLDGEQDRLRVVLDGRTFLRTYVTVYLPHQAEGDVPVPEAIRFRSALRRNILDATQALTPVPDAADIPAALVQVFGAIQTLDAIDRQPGMIVSLPSVRHSLYRILDHLTGNDHSGCSGKPSVADFGRAEEGGVHGEVGGEVRLTMRKMTQLLSDLDRMAGGPPAHDEASLQRGQPKGTPGGRGQGEEAGVSERRPWFHMRAALDRGVAAGLSGDELADSLYVDLVDRGILPPWDHEGEQGVLIAVIDADGGETA